MRLMLALFGVVVALLLLFVSESVGVVQPAPKVVKASPAIIVKNKIVVEPVVLVDSGKVIVCDTLATVKRTYFKISRVLKDTT